jgi:hypothetical protein
VTGDGPRVPQPTLTGMTVTQQRRANALILVRFLWPTIDSGEAVRRANWIISGRPVP